MAASLRTITVATLRRLLENEDDDALVVFTADYGDICHTPQALPLRGRIEEVTIEKSGYSHSGYAIVDADEEDGGIEGPTYLVIR